jgi:hypothetical protein
MRIENRWTFTGIFGVATAQLCPLSVLLAGGFCGAFGELIFTQTRDGPLELPALALTFRQINLCA